MKTTLEPGSDNDMRLFFERKLRDCDELRSWEACRHNTSDDWITEKQLHQLCDRAKGRFDKVMEIFHNIECLGSGDPRKGLSLFLSAAKTNLDGNNSEATTVSVETQKK